MVGTSTASIADSHVTKASLRTLDKERIRQRALYLNMKEKLRMSICVRIQKQCKKTPAQAQLLAQQVLESVQANGLSSNLSDSELEQLVKQLSRPGQEAPLVQKEKTPQKAATPKKAATPQKAGTPLASGKKSRKPSSQDKKPTGMPPPVESVYVTESQLQQASVGFVLPPRKSPQKHKQDDIWNTLVQIQGMEEAKENQAKLQVKVKQRSSWNKELNAQVQDKLHRKSLENHENQKYFEETMQKLEQMNQEEKQKELDRIARAKEQNRIQEEQRQYKLAKKQLELETRRQAELQMAEAIAQQKAHEEAKEIARKEAEKLKMERVLKENEALLEKKRQIKQADRELELKLAEDYIKMEEKKDAMRQHGLDELSKKIQAKMKFFDDTSKAEMDMKNKQEELRILRYQQDYDQRQAQLDEKKRQDAIKRNHDQQEYLKQQMKLKKERERQEKEDYDKQAEMWRTEREREERRQRQVDMQRAQKNLMQQSWLKQQMQEKEEEALAADHTPLEVQLNKALLQKLEKLQENPPVSKVASATRQRSRELHEREKLKADPRLKPATRK